MERSELIPITGKGGWRGGLERHPVDHGGSPHAVIHLDGNEPILVPTDMVRKAVDGAYHLPLTREELLRGSQPDAGVRRERPPAQEFVVPVVVEEVDVQKQQWETGRVRVRMEMREREEIVDEPLVREEVRVERVPVNQVVESAPAMRHEGDTTIIPVLEEVLLVEKRLMLKEEVRITRLRFEAHQPQRVLLRSEEPKVERLRSDDGPAVEKDAA
jgi:uncharacterized protein (TIGR02271 family)